VSGPASSPRPEPHPGGSPAAAVVRARGLRKSYGGKSVVDGVDLEVAPGECFGLLGPNGAGKTTTLRMLLGMTAPDAGELHVLGHAVPAAARVMRARVGVVPQMDNLDPDFTVAENLLTYARYFGLAGPPVARRIEELIAFAALEAKREARIDTLSGGMKRRLTLARALVNDPRLIILDEPTTGLDPQARQLIWGRLRGLVREGRTLILTTHYMEEAERLCGRVAIMDRGRILASGGPRELIAEHIERHVIEVHGEDLDQWLVGGTAAHAARMERVGETAFCYVDDERPFIEDLCRYEHLRFLHRPASLEDVFLKLTGRELRD
jgi:lipooligosaccharide transport system ATP-binding protein